MKYDFDRVLNREGTDSYKWDFHDKVFGTKDLLPMWVADMDIKAPEQVIKAIKDRAGHGIFGYTLRSEKYNNAIINWMKRRHNWNIKRDWISFSPGVVPGLVTTLLGFTEPGDGVVIQSPVYYPFFSIIKNNNRVLLNNQLKKIDGKYEIDFDDLDEKTKDHKTKILILCSPANPVGRVWGEDELKRIAEICIKNNVLIASDEIHQDIIYEGYTHIPIASISEEISEQTITYTAPSKTFNLAGLNTSIVITSNKKYLEIYNKTLDSLEIKMGNIFGYTALEAAYNYGDKWLDNLIIYLQNNIDFIDEYIKKNIPEVKFVKPEGAYLAWLDFSNFNLNNSRLKEFIIEEAKLGLNDGTTFGPGGEGFQRMNFACPKSTVEEGLNRLNFAIKKL